MSVDVLDIKMHKYRIIEELDQRESPEKKTTYKNETADLNISSFRRQVATAVDDFAIAFYDPISIELLFYYLGAPIISTGGFHQLMSQNKSRHVFICLLYHCEQVCGIRPPDFVQSRSLHRRSGRNKEDDGRLRSKFDVCGGEKKYR